MENASKALIIAGSILVVLLLIAVGVRIFNSTQGTTEATKTTMNSTEITMFNNKFMAYTGTNKSVANVKAIKQVVIANNATNPNHQVGFTIGGTDYLTTSTANLDPNKKYTIGASYNSDKGYITTINITIQT